MKIFLVRFVGWCYRHIARPIIFLFPSEPMHEIALRLGYLLGRVPGIAKAATWLFRTTHPQLSTVVAGVSFENPIGLAAGFDYRAELPRMLPALGFGFGSVGTLTHEPYEGNPKPRLGRLVQSQALLVNKGFKNDGVTQTLKKYHGQKFAVPIGVSIGRTNTLTHTTQGEAIADVLSGFREAEASQLSFSYYELNISCPNLRSPIEFYEPQHLAELLGAVFTLALTHPIFIKMPIDRTDEQFTAMLDVITTFPVAGIIVGNLLRSRIHRALVPEEVARYPKGNFGGKPTFDDSNRHIALAYQHTKGALTIVGCGGVFTAEDAYTKIRLGATLIQLASGLVFRGPFVAGEITASLPKLLARDGCSHYQDAVGSGVTAYLQSLSEEGRV